MWVVPSLKMLPQKKTVRDTLLGLQACNLKSCGVYDRHRDNEVVQLEVPVTNACFNLKLSMFNAAAAFNQDIGSRNFKLNTRAATGSATNMPPRQCNFKDSPHWRLCWHFSAEE